MRAADLQRPPPLSEPPCQLTRFACHGTRLGSFTPRCSRRVARACHPPLCHCCCGAPLQPTFCARQLRRSTFSCAEFEPVSCYASMCGGSSQSCVHFERGRVCIQTCQSQCTGVPLTVCLAPAGRPHRHMGTAVFGVFAHVSELTTLRSLRVRVTESSGKTEARQ